MTHYKEMFGLLIWAAELGWVYIILETVLLSTYLDLPRRGRLEQAFYMFGYLRANPKRKLCFDSQHPTINERSFAAHEWYDFYSDSKEDILADAPNLRENVVSTHFFVDTDQARDMATRRSQTGALIFLNKAPILWYE